MLPVDLCDWIVCYLVSSGIEGSFGYLFLLLPSRVRLAWFSERFPSQLDILAALNSNGTERSLKRRICSDKSSVFAEVAIV